MIRKKRWQPVKGTDTEKTIVPLETRDSIRIMLLNNSLSQTWLINQIIQSGIVTDKSELSSVLSGTRSGAKACAIADRAVEILKRYEERMEL